MPTSRGRSAGPASALPAWPVQAVLGLVLIAAGTASFYRLLLEVGDGRLMLIPAFLAEAQVVVGIGMVSGLAPFATRRLGLTLFGGLGAANLLSAFAGRCTGGGLGPSGAGPWSLALLGAAASGALLASRPRDDSGPEATPGYPELVALGLAGVLAGLAGWQEGGLVTVAGTATLDGAPLGGATLTLTGDSGELVLETDAAGRFRCPLVRPGIYAASVRGVARPSGADVEARVLAPSWVTVEPCPEEETEVGFRSPPR